MSALDQPKRTFDPPDVLAAVKREIACPERSRSARPVRSFRFAFTGWAFAGVAAVILAVWIAASWNPTEPPADKARIMVKSPAPIERPVLRPPIMASNGGAGVHKHRSHFRGTTNSKPSPTAPSAPKPEVEYLVVYTPEPPVERSGEYEAEGSAIPMSDSYTIRMTDHDAGEVTTLSVQSEVEPGAEPKVTIGYAVTSTKADSENERSFLNENLSVPDDRSNTLGVG
jgi:hypothetical protein